MNRIQVETNALVLPLLLCAGVTYALSQTLILPAMPALVAELDAGPLAVSWLLTAYLVSASVATPLIGRLGDLLGRGRMLTGTMAVFCAGSLLCAARRLAAAARGRPRAAGRRRRRVPAGLRGHPRHVPRARAHARDRDALGQPRRRRRPRPGGGGRDRRPRRPVRDLLGRA